MRPLAECRLYTFVDTAYLAGRDPTEVARQLCDGGADLIQLRAKRWASSEVRALAERLLPICQAANVGLVVNDYPEVAVQVGAHLCHLGQEDFFDRGWTRVGEVFPGRGGPGLGLSSHAPLQALRAVEAGAMYVAIGPVYATPTKPGRPGVTLDYVRWASQHLSVPWFAIGGITLTNVGEVLQAGARRICVVSAILQAADVQKACLSFCQSLASGAASTAI